MAANHSCQAGSMIQETDQIENRRVPREVEKTVLLSILITKTKIDLNRSQSFIMVALKGLLRNSLWDL